MKFISKRYLTFILRSLVKITCNFVSILIAKLNIDFQTSVTRVGKAMLALRLPQIYNNLSHNTGIKLKVILTKALIIQFLFCINEVQAKYFISEDIAIIKEVTKYANNGNLDQSIKKAKEAKDLIIYKTMLWLKLRDEKSNIKFADLKKFIDSNPKWADLEHLIKLAEKKITPQTPLDIALIWYKNYKPSTLEAKKKYLEFAYSHNLLSNQELQNIVKYLWINSNFYKGEEQIFLKKFGKYISGKDHELRIDRLLWDGMVSNAERLLPMISRNKYAIFSNRIKIQRNNSIKLTDEIYRLSQFNEGLLYDVINLLDKRKETKIIEQIIKNVPENSQHDTKWWVLKSKSIRELMDKKKYNNAYNLAKKHGNKDIVKYVDAEWLSGWIALRFLKEPKIALNHFQKALTKAKLPISKSRCEYWIGRSYEVLGNLEAAKKSYISSSSDSTNFYGQLSLAKISNTFKIKINKPSSYSKEDLRNHFRNINVKVAYILSYMHHYELVNKFLSHAILEAKTPGELSLITGMGIELNKYHVSIAASKQANYKKKYITTNGYPVINLPSKNVDPSFVHAIIRQESLFNDKVISSAGAVGMMQIMPSTAKQISNEIKDLFTKDKLYRNTNYNLKIGIHYLDKLMKKFQGSHLLSAAAYNAGENSVRKWIEKYGDPRNKKNTEEVVDWIESISFYETRNYVQRVLEATNVYKVLHSSDAASNNSSF